jgi:hypothetical protein
MTSKKQSEKLQDVTRLVANCINALEKGRGIDSRHIRELACCNSCEEMSKLEKYLYNKDPFIRGQVARVLAISSSSLVIEAILRESNKSAFRIMLQGLEDVKCQDVEDLTSLLRMDDDMLVQRVFEMFVNVGRADLLLGYGLAGDDIKMERVKRYLNEQGWLK